MNSEIIAAIITGIFSLLGAIIGSFGSNIVITNSKKNKLIEDKKLYLKIEDFFTPQIKEKINPKISSSLSSPFEKNLFSSLYDFIHFSENPQNKFLILKLEKKRKKLLEIVREFCSFMSENCFFENDKVVTKYWLSNHKDYNYENEKELEVIRDKLDSLADKVWEVYIDFVETARVILNS